MCKHRHWHTRSRVHIQHARTRRDKGQFLESSTQGGKERRDGEERSYYMCGERNE